MSHLPPVNHLPPAPGIYIFRGEAGQSIYVGKALNLRARVKSHFRPPKGLFKKDLLREQTSSVDYIAVESEIEALLLEANLIKKFQPKYNTRLKDDKSYLYIKITAADDFPKVLTARREKLPGVKYFGPFPSARTVRNTLKALRNIFPYCNCNFRLCQKKKSCFYVELGLDAGACLGLVGKNEYRQMIRRLIFLLEGKREKVLLELGKLMVAAAQKEDFEKAQALKKQILGIEYLTRPVTSPQIYLEDPEYLAKKRQEGLLALWKLLSLGKVPQRIECFDISDIHGREATGSMVVFQKGEPDKSQYRRFRVRLEGKPNDIAMMKEVISRRLGHSEWPMADLIVVDGGKGQVSGALDVFAQAGLQIPVIGLAKKLEEIIVAKKQWSNLPRRPAGETMKQFTVFRLPSNSPALHLLQALRDEAHRFALTYHRKLRLKNLSV